VEIIDSGEDPGDDLIQIAFADTREEAALIRGLLREDGIRSLAKQASINGPSLGAYTRSWLVALAVLALAFVLFLLLHGS
jgi:hypothetical protein